MATDDEGDRFLVAFQGQRLACVSVDDATAVKRAERVLADGFANEFAPSELERLAGILIRYGHLEAARTLIASAARTRNLFIQTQSPMP